MNRRLSLGERQELAEQRAARRRELLEQATTMRQQLAEQAQQCAQIAADEPHNPTTERIAAQIERLSAARLALDLAARLLQTEPANPQWTGPAIGPRTAY